MPIMCVVQMPKGKDPEKINQTLVDLSNVLMNNFDAASNEVRVTIEELPKGRYIAGGVMDYEMPAYQNGAEESK